MRESVCVQHPPEHAAVSVASLRSQSSPPGDGGVQARTLIFLPHAQEGSHWDHSLHSCQTPLIAKII